MPSTRLFPALPVLLAGALLASTAEAGAKPPKLHRLQPFADALSATAPLDDAGWKALKTADSCLRDDQLWSSNDQGRTANQIYELAASAVLCWQAATKKAEAAGPNVAPLAAWVRARTRYVETFRAYIWGIDAKLTGDRKATCTRLLDAARSSALTQEAAQGLSAFWTTPDAQGLSAWLDREAAALGATVAAEAKTQQCE